MKLAKLDAAFGDRHSFHFSGGGEVLCVCREETFCTEEGGQHDQLFRTTGRSKYFNIRSPRFYTIVYLSHFSSEFLVLKDINGC